MKYHTDEFFDASIHDPVAAFSPTGLCGGLDAAGNPAIFTAGAAVNLFWGKPGGEECRWRMGPAKGQPS